LPSSPDDATDDTGARWFEILADFELQLARVDLLAAELAEAGVVLSPDERAGLTPTGDPGPLSDSERRRALAILEAQKAAMAQLERLRLELARHIGMTKAATVRIPDSVYLDRIA
jgi:hypothetical protein